MEYFDRYPYIFSLVLQREAIRRGRALLLRVCYKPVTSMSYLISVNQPLLSNQHDRDHDSVYLETYRPLYHLLARVPNNRQ